ncbi:MAG: hypothetical protein SV765_04760 [Pseudomonadota bacterium]|nr:hypothetical protein [Pseudomonadota bacterium]
MQLRHNTPLEQIESFCLELQGHYQAADDKELRVAAKLMLVALDQLKRWGGPQWESLVRDYVDLAVKYPEKFERVLQSNRSSPKVLAKAQKGEQE